MSLIERAAKRLEELRRAGYDAPDDAVPAAADGGRRAPAHTVEAAMAAMATQAVAPQPAPVSRSRRIELDLGNLAANGFVTPDMPRSRIADEFRVLKRPLLANAGGKRGVHIRHGNLIMVTSAVPGEGKSFCAVNLALSIAMELDRTVLLVDADVARPSLPKVLGLPVDGKGLLDVLQADSTDIGDVMLRSSVDKLSILPSGTPHPQATELLASETMSRLLADMEARYSDRIIIFDSPPLLVTTEARVLATQMGQIVFVVHAESTLQSEVKRALATIEACPLKMVVLNQARTVAQGAYGYGYGYGY